jgi:hypothetical protein
MIKKRVDMMKGKTQNVMSSLKGCIYSATDWQINEIIACKIQKESNAKNVQWLHQRIKERMLSAHERLRKFTDWLQKDSESWLANFWLNK